MHFLGGTGIYAKYRPHYRITVMPHGSKAQTLAVALFRTVHETSLVFATPQEHDPNRYSSGCAAVWALKLGNTDLLVNTLREARVMGDYIQRQSTEATPPDTH